MIGFGMPGMTEWIVILVIVLIVFGPGRLPDVFKKAGEGIKAFKDASEGKADKPAVTQDDAEEEVVVRKKKAAPAQIAEDELDEEASAKETQPSGSTRRPG